MRGGSVRRRCMLGYTDYSSYLALCAGLARFRDARWKREAALHAGVH
jgi:hypothetical protein